MLLLARRKGESVLIGDTVEITVIALDARRVRLGIRAPTEVPVYRRELYESIRTENRRSADADPDARARAFGPPPRARRKP